MSTKVTAALAARLVEVVEAATAPAGTGPVAPVPHTGPAAPATTPAPGQEGIPVTTDQLTVAPPSTPTPDVVLAAARDLARAAAAEVAGNAVGDHLGVEVESPLTDGPTLTHSFASTDRAYVGWRWAVTLARAEGDERVTVDEVVLLPGSAALLAPAWVPWADRVQAGDLGAGDLLPPAPDDERLVPAYAEAEAELADEVFWELGLGRVRVLSVEGRIEAAERWWSGDGGPDSPAARKAPGQCGDCGFRVPLAGSLRQAFGVCANAVAPDDGRVVALSHGCGAHSETVVDGAHAATAGLAVQDDEFDVEPVTGLVAGVDDDDEDLVVEDLVVEDLVVEGLLVDGLEDEDLPVEDPAVEDLAVEDPAVEDLPVEDLAVEDPAAAAPVAGDRPR